MNELANCPNCNQLFVQTQFRTVCMDCYKEEERKFEAVYAFLRKRENRSANIDEVVERTSVEEELVLKFIRLGRIQISNFKNLGYPCEKCRTMIREGKICLSCKKDLEAQISQMKREENHRSQMAQKTKKTFYANTPEK
ncbi:TIGR03826 family flagellar region protein [Metabacillus sp. RGM 3146]|uniref:TIGR03826 family flagellar region protein n=1 Tax=Metabacillus sp. RGM 3146 TaxID=3401092 RepID=UPI003B98FC1A